MHKRVMFSVGAAALLATGVGAWQYGGLKGILITGKTIPIQTQDITPVGSFPVNMATSPDGRYVAVTNSGFRQQLSILDAETGKLVSKVDFNGTSQGKKQALYYGLAFKQSGGKTLLYASNGYLDRVSVHELSSDGQLTFVENIEYAPTEDPSGLPRHFAGVSFANNGQTVLVAGNQSHAYNNFKGELAVISGNGERSSVTVDGFPLAVLGGDDGHAYVSSEMTGAVTRVNLTTKKMDRLKTGENPSYMIWNKDQTELFVTNANSDTLSIIDPKAWKVRKTILLRPADFPGLPGSTPLGLTLSRDEKTAYIAMADLNAVAVVDLEAGALKGYLSAGWYPTSVTLSRSGKYLLVANAKGSQVRNPNDKSVGDLGTYSPNILEGTVQRINLAAAMTNLSRETTDVLENNRIVKSFVEGSRKAFVKPPIEHVIYVVKENRTYDQVLGDLNYGNGDPNLCLFPRDITPNQHALAERFVVLDNFYVCAEVSADGWNWSTAGMANEYVQRNSFTNYSRRGRNYDFEGQTNGSPLDMEGKHSPAKPAGGYIWDQAARDKVSMRNYGFFINNAVPNKLDKDKPIAEGDIPNQRVLKDSSCLDFCKYNMEYADSEAWVKHGLPKAPRQLAEFGSQKDPSRMTAWLREYSGYIKEGKAPKFMMVRLGRDHTSGTSPGQPSPEACVADNDYAVGQLVEAVSNGPFWKKTAIVVLEDDAQAGTDHVDSHRSICFVISPYIERGKLDSGFYNTDSALRTIALLAGIKPWNQYIASAYPINVFSPTAVNPAPYRAILPAREIVGKVNTRSAYRSGDSERLIDVMEEESLPDFELNDILWGAIKGPNVPRPKTPNTIWKAPDQD